MAIVLTNRAVSAAKPRAAPYEIRGQSGLILRVQPSGYKGWYVSTRRNQRAAIGDATRITLARAEVLAREAIERAADPSNPAWTAPKATTLSEFIKDEYTPWLRANRKRTDKTLRDLARNFKKWDDRRLIDLSKADLDKYVSARLAQGCSAATVVRDLNSVRGVLRLAVERGFLRETIFRGWRRPKVEDTGVTRYLAPEEETRLHAALRQRDEIARKGRFRANKFREKRGYEQLPPIPKGGFDGHLTPMVIVSINTGLRYGELAALEWASIDLPNRNLTVLGRTAKGAKTRHIPLNDEAHDVLTRWRVQSSGKLVFPNAEGKPIGTVKTAWLAILEEAKIEEFRWHDLRHTFASKLVQRGVDLAVVRDLLGHGDFALTLRYSHLSPKAKADAVARLGRAT